MNMPKVGEFCWNELAVSDVQKARDFYGKVFGWKFSEHNMGDMTYTMIKTSDQANDQAFGGIWAIPKEKTKDIPPHWMGYVLVENLDQSLEQAQSFGATVIKPAQNAGEMGRFAIITDPCGAHLALWQTLVTK